MNMCIQTGVIIRGLDNTVEFSNDSNIMMQFVNYCLHTSKIK